jgi:hypothetical protein
MKQELNQNDDDDDDDDDDVANLHELQVILYLAIVKSKNYLSLILSN